MPAPQAPAPDRDDAPEVRYTEPAVALATERNPARCVRLCRPTHRRRRGRTVSSLWLARKQATLASGVLISE